MSELEAQVGSNPLWSACRFLLQQQLRGTVSAESLAEDLKPPQTGDFSVKARLHSCTCTDGGTECLTRLPFGSC